MLDALLFPKSASDVKSQWEAKPGQFFERKGEHELNRRFARSIVLDIQPKSADPATQVTMKRVGLLIQDACFEVVVFVDAEAPVVVEAQVTVERYLTGILKERVALQISMPYPQLDIRIHQPVKKCANLPEAWVQKRNLRINRQIKPGNRLESHPIENVRKELARRCQWIRARDGCDSRRNCLRERIVKINVDMAVNVEPVKGGIIPASLQPVSYAEPQDRPSINRVG